MSFLILLYLKGCSIAFLDSKLEFYVLYYIFTLQSLPKFDNARICLFGKALMSLFSAVQQVNCVDI